MNKTAYQMTPTIKDLEQSNISLKLSICGFHYHLVVHHLHFPFISYTRIKLSRLHSFYIFIMLVNLSIRFHLEPKKYKRKKINRKIKRKSGSKEIFVKNKKLV